MAVVDVSRKISSPTPVTAQNSDAIEHVVKFAASGSVSTSVDLGYARLSRISMPSTWTTADLTFQVSSDDGETFQDLYDYLGTETTIQAAASREITLDLQPFLSIRDIRVRSGTAATPVAQAAATEIKLICLK